MSWTANIQGSYGTGSMTVSWTAPASLPNTYTVTAQPGGLTASVVGSATSATLTTTLTGVAYNVSVVANYSGSTQTATATLISPPAALKVPLTTDVAPWLWYDAADPTTIRCNSNGVLTEWYNKGTSAGSTNGNVSITGSVSYGSTSLNSVPNLSFSYGSKCTTPSITATSQSFSYFAVFRPTVANTTAYNILLTPPLSSNGLPIIALNDNTTNLIRVGNQVLGWRTIASYTIPQNTSTLISSQLSTTIANNIIAVNGTPLSLSTNTASSGLQTNIASTYDINSNQSNDFAEIIMYMGDLTATQRLQIEGYLAWKWGLQSQLPATHPFSTANMASTMAAYNLPRTYVSTFANLSAYNSGLLRGLGIDPSGNMYVGASTAIVKITPTGVVSNFTTVGGTQNRTGIAVGPNGDVYVHERNYPAATGTVRRFTNSGSVVYTATIPEYGFGISVDNNGNAYSHVGGTNAMYKISPTGTLSTRAFGDKWGTATFDSSNNAYLLNYIDYSLYKISADGTTTYIAGSGTYGSVDGIREGASFRTDYTPGMWVDSSSGIIYIAENNCVRMVTQSGVVRTIAGSTSGTTGSANGLDITARFNGTVGAVLEGIVRDRQGNFYIIDSGNASIRKMSLGTLNQIGTYVSVTSTYQSVADEYGNLYVCSYSGKNVIRVSPNGTTSVFAGSASGASGGLNGAGTAATFNSANGIVRDGLGNLYVAEHAGNRIRKITPAGLVTILVPSISSPLGFTMGPDGNIYASTHSDHTIRRITLAGAVSLYAGAAGQLGNTDNVHRLSARFNYPCHLAFDSNGIMYIADGNNNLIRKIDLSSNVTTFAGDSSALDADGTGIGAKINSPHGIAIDRNNIMYVSEWTGGSVRRITPSAVVSTIASGLGNCTYCHIDSAQNLWVSNPGNNLVRHIAINAVPTGSVSINGSMTQGQTITANTTTLVDSDGLGSFTYAWSASPTANGVYTTISGATGATFTLAEAQVGKYIKVAVSYTDGRGTAEAISAVSVGSIANVNDPGSGLAISGVLESGLTVSANLANLSDPDGIVLPYTYRWASSTSASSGFVDISGATGTTYTLTTTDVGKYIRLTVGYTNNYGQPDSSVATSAITVIAGNTAVSGSLDISGSLREDATVRAVANLVDPDGIGPLTYIWSSSASANGVFRVDASGTDLSGITLSFGQTTRFLRVEVRYVDLKGVSENMISTVVGPIIAHGPPDAPTIGAATAGETSISLSWTPPINNGGRPITGYEVRDELGNFVISADISSSSVIIPNLLPGIARRFTVVALNERGSSNQSGISVSASPIAPSIASIESGVVPEVIPVPVVVAGIPAIVQKLTPAVEANGTKTVAFNPEPEVKAAVAIANLPAEVEKVVVATAAPQNGYTTLKIAAFDSSGSNVSNFAASPLTITLDIPGYTAETLLVRTFQEIGGAVSDSVIATRNPNGSYTMTLTHLTYLRVSQNIPCFVAGTKILTAAGYKAVEEIVDGELVATADGRALPCKLYITEIDETTKENAPYVIPANTFGPRCPVRDLTLSPLHAIQIRRGVWQIPKAAATIYAGVRQLPIGTSCTYYHLEMPNYLTDNIVADGTVVESYGARQLKGRRVEYKFDDVVGGFTRTITEARARGVAVKRA